MSDNQTSPASTLKPVDTIRLMAVADVPVGWRRAPLLVLAAPQLGYFLGWGPMALWLCSCLALELGVFVLCRCVAADQRQWRGAYIGAALCLPWCWISYACMLWVGAPPAMHISAVCALFIASTYVVLCNYYDRRIMLGLMAPLAFVLFAMVMTELFGVLPLFVLPMAFLNAVGMVAILFQAASLMHRSNSSLRDAQAELTVERDMLDERVCERTAELAKATERAEAASRTKSQFIANMSHELRTPLNAVIGYAEILIDDLKDNKSAAGDAQRIQAAGRHLLGMVNDILDLAKADTQELKVSLRIVDVAALVKEAVEAARPLAAAKRNSMELFIYQGVEPIECDPARLSQAVTNLISNACKFTSEGTITIAVGLEDENWLSIKVRDTGAGIAPDQMMRLFQPFSQGDGSTTRETSGAGLGLITTRNFARLLGGDVLVHSKPGIGSQFTLRLPTARRERVAA